MNHAVPVRPDLAPVAVRCANLVKRYDDVVAVDGLSLEILTGECFGLLGPNGAGKTTTIEILEGLTRPDEGEVEILGERWGVGADRALRQRLGVQLQETRLAEKLTVEETLRIFRSFYVRGRSIDDVLAIVELETKRKSLVGKLSGGQRQRLAVGCALVNQPALLFLDEPTSGLDPQSRRQLWALLGSFQREGGTILLTTHYMDEAEVLCDRVAIVDRGKIIALDPPRALIARLGAEHVIECTVADGQMPPSPAVLRQLPGVRDARVEDHNIVVTAEQVHLALPALLASLDERHATLSMLTTHHATLEDVFVSLTGRHLRET